MAQQTIGDKLVYAAGKGYIDDVAALLNQKADVNAKDQLGNTALIAASGAGHVEVVKLLLSKGVNVNAQNTQGNTALHQAVWRNHLDAVKVLVTSGAKQDVRNGEGKLAADWASTPELKALLGVKSNNNAPEEDLSKVEDLEFGDSDEE